MLTISSMARGISRMKGQYFCVPCRVLSNYKVHKTPAASSLYNISINVLLHEITAKSLANIS